MSVPENVKNYSKNLTLVTHRLPCHKWRVSRYSLRLYPWQMTIKLTAKQIARERSDKTTPSEQAGVQLFQLLFCGAQERWRTPPDTTSQAHQQSALQASVRDDFAGTDSAAGTGCVRGFKGRVLSHSDSTTLHAFSQVCSRVHSVPVPFSPVWAGFVPAHFLEVHSPPQSERDERSQLFG